MVSPGESRNADCQIWTLILRFTMANITCVHHYEGAPLIAAARKDSQRKTGCSSGVSAKPRGMPKSMSRTSNSRLQTVWHCAFPCGLALI